MLLWFLFYFNLITLRRPCIMPQILHLKKLSKHIRDCPNLFILYHILSLNAIIILNLFLHTLLITEILYIIKTVNRSIATGRHFHGFDLVNFMSHYLWLGGCCWFRSFRLNIFCDWRVGFIVNSWNYNLALCVLAFGAVLYKGSNIFVLYGQFLL